jgi:hypothetical protein
MATHVKKFENKYVKCVDAGSGRILWFPNQYAHLCKYFSVDNIKDNMDGKYKTGGGTESRLARLIKQDRYKSHWYLRASAVLENATDDDDLLASILDNFTNNDAEIHKNIVKILGHKNLIALRKRTESEDLNTLKKIISFVNAVDTRNNNPTPNDDLDVDLTPNDDLSPNDDDLDDDLSPNDDDLDDDDLEDDEIINGGTEYKILSFLGGKRDSDIPGVKVVSAMDTYSGVRFESGEIMAEDNSYDLVICNHTLNKVNAKNLETVVGEFSRILKRGGKLVILGYNVPSDKIRKDMIAVLNLHLKLTKNRPGNYFSGYNSIYRKTQVLGFKPIDFDNENHFKYEVRAKKNPFNKYMMVLTKPS